MSPLVSRTSGGFARRRVNVTTTITPPLAVEVLMMGGGGGTIDNVQFTVGNPDDSLYTYGGAGRYPVGGGGAG